MPQPPEMHSPEYLKNLTGVIAALVGIILAIVAAIANWFKKTQEGQQDQLDEGIDEFTALKLRIQHLEDSDSAMRKWCIEMEKDLDMFLKEMAKLHDFREAVRIYHKQHHGDDL